MKTTVKEIPVKCPVCEGSGKNPFDKDKPCETCGGDGLGYIIETVTEEDKVPQVDWSGTQWIPTVVPSYQPLELITCTNCWGSGKIYTGWYGYPWHNQSLHTNCPICDGTGKVTNYSHTLYFNNNTTNKTELK